MAAKKRTGFDKLLAEQMAWELQHAKKREEKLRTFVEQARVLDERSQIQDQAMALMEAREVAINKGDLAESRRLKTEIEKLRARLK